MLADKTIRKRGLAVLLADTFLMFAGFFMLVPLISVHYVNDLKFAAASVGFVLAARQLTQQGLTVFGGALADRWGAKGLICWGLLLRFASFVGLAWATTFWLLLLFCVLAAIGGALFEAPRSAAVAVLTEPHERTRFYTLNGIIGGLGMTIGPLVGALLLRVDFRLVCFVAGACFALAALLTALALPSLAASASQQSVLHGISLAAHDRPFVLFTALLAGFWFMWVQLSISLPLAAQRWPAPTIASPFGSFTIEGVAWVYALNAGLTVVLQYPLLWMVERWVRPMTTVMLGTGLMAVSLGLVALAQSLGALLGCVVIFALGSMLVQPTQQTVTATMSNPQTYGSYFGFNALALAFGGSIGNYSGGWLVDTAAQIRMPMLPWIVFSGVGLFVSFGLLLLDRSLLRRERAALRAEERVEAHKAAKAT